MQTDHCPYCYEYPWEHDEECPLFGADHGTERRYYQGDSVLCLESAFATLAEGDPAAAIRHLSAANNHQEWMV